MKFFFLIFSFIFRYYSAFVSNLQVLIRFFILYLQVYFRDNGLSDLAKLLPPTGDSLKNDFLKSGGAGKFDAQDFMRGEMLSPTGGGNISSSSTSPTSTTSHYLGGIGGPTSAVIGGHDLPSLINPLPEYTFEGSPSPRTLNSSTSDIEDPMDEDEIGSTTFTSLESNDVARINESLA